MLVSTLEQVQKYLPSFNLKVKVDRLKDFLAYAQEWLVDHILGEDIEALLEAAISGETDPHEELRTKVSRAICALAYLTVMAEMDLQLSEAGFVVQNNQGMSPASQQRTDRFVQSLHNRLTADCDAIIKYLLKTAAYEEWRETDQFAHLTEAFIPTMAIMRQYSGTAVQLYRWQDFYDSIPKMVEALRGPVANYISNDEVDALLQLYRMKGLSDPQKKVLRWIRMSVMAHVAGTTNADHFAIEARNFMLEHESAFPEFVSSDRYELPKPFDFGDGTVANCL